MGKRPSMQQAIKAKCFECSADSTTAVRCCQVIYCSLWLFRFGRPPSSTPSAYLDRDFFEKHIDMPEEEFNRLLRDKVLSAGQKQDI